MKLHLPLGLLAAVLTALSLSTARGDISISTVDGVMTVTGTPSADYMSTVTSANNLTESVTKIIFAVTEPSSAAYFSTDTTISQAVQIGDSTIDNSGLWLRDGSSGKTLTFSGIVTGSGTIGFVGPGGRSATPKKILFTGDTTGFSGTITMNNTGAGVIQFGDGSDSPETSAEKGLAGTGTITLTSTNDQLIYNYGTTNNPVYVTNTITGSGQISLSGAASMVFTSDVSANSLTVSSAAGATTFKGSVSATTLALSSPSSVTFETTVTATTINQSAGTVSITGGNVTTYNVTNGATASLDNLTIGTLYVQNGSVTLTGDTTLTTFQGANASGSSATLDIGFADGSKTSKVTTTNFYGNYVSNGSSSTINVNKGSSLSVSTLLQVARDAIGTLNINEGGTVYAKRIDMGTNASSWTGTSSSKLATVNLENGTLVLGSGGITQTNNLTQSPGQINLKSGTVGGTESWSTSLDVNIGSADTESTLTVNTGVYDTSANTFSTSEFVDITLGKTIAQGTNTLNKIGSGSLFVGSESSLSTLTLTSGSLGITSTDGASGTLSIDTLTKMTSDGALLINLGESNSSDKITVTNHSGTLYLTVSAYTTGTYEVFQGMESLEKSSISLTQNLSHGLSITDENFVVNSGLVTLTVTGDNYTLHWNDTEGALWSLSTSDTSWTHEGDASEYFANGDRVYFDGTGTGDVSVTISAAVRPSLISVDSSKNYTFTGSGSIIGTTSLTKDGDGTLTIDTTNSYSGGTTINAGKVVVGTNGTLGSGAVTMASGTTLQIDAAGNLSSVASGGLSVTSATVSFTTGAHTMDQTIAGSGLTLNISGTGTSVEISKVQSNASVTTVSEGASLTLGKNGNGSKSMLYGDVTIDNATLTTKGGDSFGYENSSSEFKSLTLKNNSTWYVTASNTTMSNSTMLLESGSSISLNCGTSNNWGLDLFYGTNTIGTTANSTSMCQIVLADGAEGTAYNFVNLRDGSAVFDVKRGAFELTDTSTSDLKVDVIINTKAKGLGFEKTGDGVLQLTKANTYVGQTTLSAGTILLTDDGTVGTGALVMSDSTALELAYESDADKTLANTISGTGSVKQKGSGSTVTLTGTNTYSGSTEIEAGTLKAGNASAFGTSAISLLGGATLEIDSYAFTNSVSVSQGATATQANLTTNGGQIGNLSLAEGTTLAVTGNLSLATSSTITLDVKGLTTDATSMVTISGSLTTNGSHALTLSNLSSLSGTGDYKLLTVGTGTLTLNEFVADFSTVSTEWSYALKLGDNDTTLYLSLATPTDMLTWAGTDTDNTWGSSVGNEWTPVEGQSRPTSTSGVTVLFNNDSDNQTVMIDGDVSAKTLVVNNDEDHNYTFQGDGAITGDTVLTKEGEGTLTISTSNSFTGDVTLTGGVIAVDNANALGTSGNINFDGGTLQANSDYTLTREIVQNEGKTVKLAAESGAKLTVSLDGKDDYLNDAFDISGEGTVALTNIKSAGNLTQDLTVAEESTLELSSKTPGDEIALGGSLANIAGEVSKTDGGDLLVKATYNDDTLIGTLSNTTGKIRFSGYVDGTTTNNRTVDITGTLNSPTVVVQAGATLNLKADQNINNLVVEDQNSGGGTVNVDSGVTLTSESITVGTSNGYGTLNVSGTVETTALALNNASSTVTLADGAQLTMGGDISGTGKLSAAVATISTKDDTDWASSAGLELTAASGSTTTLDTGSQTVTLSGALSGSGDLTKEGEGTLKLTNSSTGFTGNVILTDGTLDLDSVAVEAAITIKNGELTNASAYATDSGVTVDSDENATITLTGLDSAKVKSVTLAQGSTLTVTNTGNSLYLTDKAFTLTIDSSNLSSGDETGKTAVVTADTLTLTGYKTTINMTSAAVKSLVREGSNKLFLTSGTLAFSDDIYTNVKFNPLLTTLGYTVTGTEGGAIILDGGATGDVYWVINSADSDSPSINQYRTLDPFTAVYLDDSQVLSVSLDGAPTADADGLIVRNLTGTAGTKLTVSNSSADAENSKTLVQLVNQRVDENKIDPDGNQVFIATDSTMDGSVTSGDNVVFLKQGAGKLTVSGDVDVDTLQVEQGSIELDGKSSIDSLVLNSTGTTTATAIIGGTTTAILSESDVLGNSTDVTGGKVSISDKGELTLTGESTLAKSSISGDGTLSIGTDSKLSLTDDASLDGTNVKLTGGSLALQGTDDSQYIISTLTGDGNSTISLDKGTTLTVNGKGESSYSGSFDGKGTLAVENGSMELLGEGNKDLMLRVTNATVTLDASGSSSNTSALRALRANSTSSDTISQYGIVLNKGAELIVGTSTATDQKLNVGDGGITLNNGSTLTFNLGTSDESDLKAFVPLATTTGAITLNSGSTLKLLNDTALGDASAESIEITLMTGGSAATVGDVTFDAAFLETVYTNLTLLADGNDVVLKGEARNDNAFAPSATTPNAMAGANLVWDLRFKLGDANSQLADVFTSVSSLVSAGDKAGATRAMAAVAGSTVNALGTAQRDALKSQLDLIRNRTTLMGVPQDYTYDDLPQVHMWIEGTASSAKLDSDGDEGGYKLTTWGGTVGFDVDLSEHFTFGAALSAQYGNLSASAAEYADGDLDSYYVSIFGRYQQNRWAHTLILTGAKNDASLDRYVDYGSGAYQTKGDTDGHGFGIMYEATYDVALNENKSAIFQPLFNASIVQTRMKGYSETGAGNAGLKVGKQDWTTGTLAIGGRWLGLVGTNVFGREALAELRANIAQDLGDDQGETDVAFTGNPKFSQTVYGAKVGKTAFQFGVGLSLPVGEQGTLFCNGNGEIRSGAHAINGSLGYRYSF
jgi:autotransporter-associated beta strand protein